MGALVPRPKGLWECGTYSASLIIAIIVVAARAVPTLGQPAGATEVVTFDFHCVVQRLIVARVILGCGGNGEPCLASHVLANTKIGWCPVTHARAIHTPNTSILNSNTLVVDVVLCACRIIVMLIVSAGVRTS